ncbi:MAG: DUF2268 domain-containing protein [Bacteroidales bacterium]|nr:DUF2268 domain-containing protein [Bacteroidales bacterium]
MKRIPTILLCILLICCLVCCNHKSDKHQENDIQIKRFEQVLFKTDPQKLPQKLFEVKDDFDSPLISLYPDDPQYMQMLSGFVADPVVKDIFHITDSCFPELFWLEHQLTEAFEKMQELHPAMRCDKVFSFVGCDFNYATRVVYDEGDLRISLDQYALPHMQQYGFFQTPQYILAQCDSTRILPDCLATIARNYIVKPEGEQLSLLDYMVMEGKVQYFLSQVAPNIDETAKLRYTPEQLDWMEKNEEIVWAYFVQNRLLYETDYMRIHNFIDDAPKTNIFKDSAPRTIEYIGSRIVKAYMDKNKVSLSELFENANSQEILSQSGYRPR